VSNKVSDVNSFADIRQVVQQREAMRNHLEHFIPKVFSTVVPGARYKNNWHIGCIAEHAEAVYREQIKKLIINLPPRFMKSIIVSVGASAWILGQNPSYRIIAASGVRNLATRFNDHTRLVIKSKWYSALFPGTKLRLGQDEKNRFETISGGHRISVSVGSNFVGEGGQLGIIDDSIDVIKSFSVKELRHINDWYDQAWHSRFDNPNTALQLVIMQRLHRNDLTQHLLDLGGWHHLKLPQVAPVRVVVKFPISKREVVREKGDLLHPERLDESALESTKKVLGTYGYAAQQQQDPVALGGNRIKMHWFGKYGAAPIEYDETVLSFDTASKGKDINNPTVCMVFRRKDSLWYLLKVKRKNLIYPELKRLLLIVEAEYKPNAILIEDKSSGTQLLQEASDLRIYTTVAVEPHGDKVARMELEMPALESGVILLPDPKEIKTDWLQDFEDEVLEFPACLLFDQIDSLSQFLKWQRERSRDTSILL